MLSGLKLLPRAMSGSMIEPQLGSVLISVASVTSGNLRNHERWNQKAMLSQSHTSLPWEKAGLTSYWPVQQENQPLYLGERAPTLHHRGRGMNLP